MRLSLFYGVLGMSVTASFVIIIALCCRVLLKKAPKIFSYALWGVVLFRLLCPVSIDLPVSFVPDSVTGNVALEQMATVPNKNAAETEAVEQSEKDSVAFTTNKGSEAAVQNKEKGNGAKEVTSYKTVLPILSNVWLIGMAVLLIYSVISFIRLKRKLVGSVPYRTSERIYLSDYIETPFVIGLIRPRIYVPSGLDDTEIEYVLLHEKHHIYRKDHWVKLFAYTALILHWFNPLVWIAFVLSGKDMEMSCDEAVMRKMGGEICEEYSMLLLRLATGKTRVSPTPLAFGEGDTKERIVNVLKWKKPAKWMVFFAAAVCIVTAVGCAVNERKTEVTMEKKFEKIEDADVDNKEYIRHTYYKRSDGKWAADIVSNELGTTKTYVYEYRIVLHGRMPNAAMDCNYIVLSNRKNITFEQTWKASGLSSNSNDYFEPKDAVLVSSWDGELEAQHKEKEEDTIYIIEDQQATATPKATEEPAVILQKAIDEFGIDMVFPENATCQDAELVKMGDKSLEISYWDGISEANCTLTIRKDGKKVKTDYEFDDSLTIKWGMMGEIEVKSTADQKVVCATWEENGYTFLICAIGSGEEDEPIDPSTIGKEASYIMEAFQ